MKIKLIDFGVPDGHRPYRAHDNDAGADVYMPYDCTLQPGEIAKVPLGFGDRGAGRLCGLCVPKKQHGGQRSCLRAAPCGFRLPGRDPRDHKQREPRAAHHTKGYADRQLVITPVVIADFVSERDKERGTGAFGSTGE